MAVNEGGNAGDFNSTTEVTIVSAPGSGINRIIKSIKVSNIDTVSATVKLRLYKAAAVVFELRVTLAADGYFTIDEPWVLDATDEQVKGVLGGAITTDQPQFDAAYMDTDVTAVTAVAAADEQYLVLSASGDLSAERVLTAGEGILGVDAGAGSTYTVGIDVAYQWLMEG